MFQARIYEIRGKGELRSHRKKVSPSQVAEGGDSSKGKRERERDEREEGSRHQGRRESVLAPEHCYRVMSERLRLNST